jgi:hypothetical protein
MNYQLHYDRLIERAKNRILSGYCEKHHIIPVCMGGSDDKENLAKLTPEEHYLAHLLLIKIYPNNYKLIWAAARMISGNENTPRKNKMYGWLRKKMAEDCSKRFKGRFVSEETRKKQSITRTGKKCGPRSEECKKKMSAASKGKPKSEAHKQALSKAKLGKRIGPFSAEHKEKIRQGNIRTSQYRDKSFFQTEEYKKKQSEKSKAAWARRKAKSNNS